MSLIKNKLKDSIGFESTRSTNHNIRTVGRVQAADEKTNTCTVVYINKSGQITEAKKASVDLRIIKDWFPEKGDIVLFDATSGNHGVIISKYTENYTKDIRSKNKLEQDVSPDGDGTVGGQIF